jgi:hypothetical protein
VRDRWATEVSIGCACIGGPEGCSLCFCHIRAEAEARVLEVPCRWWTHREPETTVIPPGSSDAR